MLIGAHLSNRRPLADARAVGAEVVQVFLSSPRSWKKPPPRPDAEELRSSPIPIYVHAPYLVNVMAGESRIRIPSRRILADTCEAAAHIGAAGVVVHGGHATGC
ncbi:MAG: deoxyribonuclease IV, partial [Acidimicrobiia bacterium]|nr:deoxyribonuclease IV [Acidimicrobiia bacterium]